eukprot:TRINITY_DN1720_c0_g1_i1.p1 TRINITY_DN1720_c0_g1~~TRINITY_DN1720_c0_g1_i1.p1  ORF type:complete len:649 (-),score=158.52 TRINITY_DN1720_c0_g1_i1:245-2191(-)
MIRRPPRSTLSSSSAASDVYKRQYQRRVRGASTKMSMVGQFGSTGLPFLPGNSFRDVTKTNHYKRHIFDATLTGQHFMRDVPPPHAPPACVPPQPMHHSLPYTPHSAVLPAFVSLDRMVLRFFGYFKEAVHESRMENYRVRKVVLLYYLEDNTIQVNEPEQENSGITQGGKLAFLKRHAIPKGHGQFFQIADFQLGGEVSFYGRSFRIVDCDSFTASFFHQNAMDLGQPEGYPYNPYDDQYMVVKEREKETRGASSVKTDDLVHWTEAMLGRATHLINEDKLSQFLDYDRKVLRWYVRDLDLNPGLYGDVQKFVIHYYLSDDTIEINETKTANSGRDPWSRLLSRQRLPIDYQKPGRKEFYSAADFKIGEVINVFGRPMLVCDCDEFTTAFMEHQFGEKKGEPVVTEDGGIDPPERKIPDFHGFGSEEDSLGSFYNLIPKKPKENWVKYLANDKKVLRFVGVLDTTAPEDQNRVFIVSYELANDSINVYEPPVRNSGNMGGKWMERSKVKKPNSTECYRAHDLYVGATLEFRKHQFRLIEADDFTLHYMERNKYPNSNLSLIVVKLKDKFREQTGVIRKTFKRLDIDNSGALDANEFRRALEMFNFELTEQEVISVMRAFDPNNDGIVRYDEFVDAVIGEGYYHTPDN